MLLLRCSACQRRAGIPPFMQRSPDIHTHTNCLAWNSPLAVKAAGTSLCLQMYSFYAVALFGLLWIPMPLTFLSFPFFFLSVSGIYFYRCSLLCVQLIETALVNHQISPNHQFHTQAIWKKKFKLSCHCRSLIVLSICKWCVKWDGGSGWRAFVGDSMYQQTWVAQHLVFKNHATYSISFEKCCAAWVFYSQHILHHFSLQSNQHNRICRGCVYTAHITAQQASVGIGRGGLMHAVFFF